MQGNGEQWAVTTEATSERRHHLLWHDARPKGFCCLPQQYSRSIDDLSVTDAWWWWWWCWLTNFTADWKFNSIHSIIQFKSMIQKPIIFHIWAWANWPHVASAFTIKKRTNLERMSPPWTTKQVVLDALQWFQQQLNETWNECNES